MKSGEAKKWARVFTNGKNDGENASNRTVTWSSSDTSVVSVSNKGAENAIKAGSAAITAETVDGLKAECSITVNERQNEAPAVIASVSAPANVTAGNALPYDFNLEKMVRVATVSFTFEKDSASVSVSEQSGYDLNSDGVVDLLDITYCQKFYRMNSGAGNWNEISHCDLDQNGVIDVQDMIILL